MSACAANAVFSRSWGVSVCVRASVLGLVVVQSPFIYLIHRDLLADLRFVDPCWQVSSEYDWALIQDSFGLEITYLSKSELLPCERDFPLKTLTLLKKLGVLEPEAVTNSYQPESVAISMLCQSQSS